MPVLHTFDLASGVRADEFRFDSWMNAPVTFIRENVGVEYYGKLYYGLDAWAEFVEARARAETWKPEKRDRNTGGHYQNYLVVGDAALE